MRKVRNLPQEVLLSALQAHIDSGEVVLCSAEEERIYCDMVGRHFARYFPYEGSTIFWPAVSAEDGRSAEGLNRARMLGFFDAVVAATGAGATDRLIVLWDEASYKALSIPVQLVREYLEELAWQPPHMYLLPSDASWCVCYRTEGDMGFGPRSR